MSIDIYKNNIVFIDIFMNKHMKGSIFIIRLRPPKYQDQPCSFCCSMGPQDSSSFLLYTNFSLSFLGFYLRGEFYFFLMITTHQYNTIYLTFFSPFSFFFSHKIFNPNTTLILKKILVRRQCEIMIHEAHKELIKRKRTIIKEK